VLRPRRLLRRLQRPEGAQRRRLPEDLSQRLRGRQERLRGGRCRPHGQHGRPQYKAAKLGLVETLAHTIAAKAKTEFLALATAIGDKLTAKDYSYIGGVLVSAGDPESGLAIVHQGTLKFPSDPGLEKILAAIKAKAASDPALTSALSGLGYP